MNKKPSLVETILGEEKCGKGMYWCNTDEICKPIPSGFNTPGQTIKPTEVGVGKPVEGSCAHTKKGKSCPIHGMDQCPMSEDRDPKGPVKSYKSPEELAKKHGVSVEQIKKQLEIGTKVEFEHTTSRGSARIIALQHLDEKPDYYTKLKKMETQKENNIIRDVNGGIKEEGLRDWFGKSKSKDGKSGWVNVVTGGTCASDEPGEGTPKCVSSAKRASMSDAERKSASRRKKLADPGQQSKSSAAKPTYVSTDSPKKKMNENHKAIVDGKEKDEEGYMANTEMDTIISAVKKLRKNIKKSDTQLPAWVQSKITKAADYIDTAADYIDSNEMSEEADKKGKGSGTKDACYTKVKSRYSVWPSAYASGALVKCRKVGAANWGNKLESLSPISLKVLEDLNLDEKCWPGYKKKGMKTMFGKRYPNCVKEEDVTIEDLNGNTFAEVIDIIKPEPIKGFKSQVEEATRLQADTGNILAVILSWRGKTYSIRMFFPQVGMPSRKDVTTEIQKVYPGALVLQYNVSSLQPGMPLIQVVNSKSKNYLLNNGTIGEETIEEVAAWQRKEGKNPEGGLNAKGVASYRKENPGSKLQTAVTTEPSKLKPGSKDAKRRKSFCARMGGMPGPMKDEKGRPTRKALSLRKWNC